MNFDEHEAHDEPRVYVSVREPRYVGVCSGHAGTGPWSAAAPVIPYDRARRAAAEESIGYDVDAEIDAWFEPPLQPSTGEQWQVWAVSELALTALRGVEREFPGLRYYIVLSSQGDEVRARALARRFSAGDDRFLALDEQRAIVSTGDIEDVAFLAGYSLRGALRPFITVLARSKQCVAALYFDWDEDRFYIAETGGVMMRHVVSAASALCFEVVDDDGHIFMMSGTPEYVANLRAWIAGGSKALPEALL
jgi:hypothetical protein